MKPRALTQPERIARAFKRSGETRSKRGPYRRLYTMLQGTWTSYPTDPKEMRRVIKRHTKHLPGRRFEVFPAIDGGARVWRLPDTKPNKQGQARK